MMSEQEIDKIFKFCCSYYSAIQQAGGAIAPLIPDNLRKMSAFELLLTCAKNNIKFVYER